MEKILEVTNLRKDYRDFSVKDISFSLDRGFIMGFIGPNGAGKTTTIKLIMNLLKKDGGDIKIFGMDNTKNQYAIKEKIGFVYDENYYFEELTISEMEKVVAPLYKSWDKALFKKYLNEFSLSPRKKIKDLSKGMKMKFSLTMALSHNPQLLIMDEPTSGLDPVVRNELLEILGSIIQDENKSIFFSTHITSDLDKIADYILFLNNGKVVLNSSKEMINEQYAVIKGEKELLLDKNFKDCIIGIKENQFGFEGLTKDKNNALKYVAGKGKIEKATLEDLILYYTRRDKNA